MIIHFISIIFHGVIRHAWCFFFGVPPFEEVQDPSSSPRREEVGRRTLGAYGGFLLSFFYRARFRESTSTTRKRQARKICPNKTPIASGVEESNSPRRGLLLLLSDSSGGRFLKKKQWSHEIIVVWKVVICILPRKSEKSVKVGTKIVTSRYSLSTILVAFPVESQQIW